MAFTTYKGKYKLRKPKKYIGDPNDIVFRSLWERQAFRWCEDSDRIKRWNSESVIIPYCCATDGRMHKYHIDLTLEWADGSIVIVEIKPKKQTKKPKPPKRKTKGYINEVMAYSKNTSKWQAAEEFAKKNNIKFEIWTEDTLRGLGIKLL